MLKMDVSIGAIAQVSVIVSKKDSNFGLSMKTKAFSFLILSISSMGLCAKPSDTEINKAKEICSSFYGEMKDFIRSASFEDQAGDILKISWKSVDTGNKIICTTNLKTERIVEFRHGGAILAGGMLNDIVAHREITNQSKSENYDKFIELAKANITSKFKEAYSTQFRGLFISKYTPENSFILCGEVNGKDPHGKYTGFRKFFSSNAKFLRGTDGDQNFYKKYKELCTENIKKID
ncbi:hypothetical protein [Vandammella animalimorsus]|uniref:hypothetical protein n=1 Tax=Vandammella animalimorsus TaxID=2029117 RepID=UPI0011784A4B|nr:hypothetical protein [Vandammella animalimorsus]